MEIKLLIDRNDEFYRFERLGRLLAFIVDEFRARGLEFNVESLEDHKGDLTVVWGELPNDEMKSIVSNGWAKENELEENVHHKCKK
jgi:hypothetical protein